MINKVREIVADVLDVRVETVLETSNVDELGIDSVDMVDIVMMLEDTFSIDIPDENFDHITTVADIVKMVKDNV